MKYQIISFFFSCERQVLLCSHSNGDLFTCEGNMLFSCVKISCLWYFIGVYDKLCCCISENIDAPSKEGFWFGALFNYSGNFKLHLRPPSI